MFGHARGAFTGAAGPRAGLIEHASGGTLFLDEIGTMPAGVQAKLLRALEAGEVRRIGENDVRHVDVRFVAATNADLQASVDAGSFRSDLFYRLNVHHIHLPPLRDRPGDIARLLDFFMERVGPPPSHGFQRRGGAACDVRLSRQRPPARTRDPRAVAGRAVQLVETSICPRSCSPGAPRIPERRRDTRSPPRASARARDDRGTLRATRRGVRDRARVQGSRTRSGGS